MGKETEGSPPSLLTEGRGGLGIYAPVPGRQTPPKAVPGNVNFQTPSSWCRAQAKTIFGTYKSSPLKWKARGNGQGTVCKTRGPLNLDSNPDSTYLNIGLGKTC